MEKMLKLIIKKEVERNIDIYITKTIKNMKKEVSDYIQKHLPKSNYNILNYRKPLEQISQNKNPIRIFNSHRKLQVNSTSRHTTVKKAIISDSKSILRNNISSRPASCLSRPQKVFLKIYPTKILPYIDEKSEISITKSCDFSKNNLLCTKSEQIETKLPIHFELMQSKWKHKLDKLSNLENVECDYIGRLKKYVRPSHHRLR